MITIRYVTNEDKRFWFELDKHLPEAEFEKKVRDRQGYVLFEDNEPVGNPCKVMREVGEHDREYFYKNEKIDWENLGQ